MSHFLCWNWNASLLNSTWGYTGNFNCRNTGKQTDCSNLSCTLVMEEGHQKSKRLSYTAKFKRKVIRCAEDKGNRKPLQFLELMKATFDRLTVAETQGSDQRVWGDTKEIHWTQERTISSNWWCSLQVPLWETQDWTDCKLWSTSQGVDKKGQIFEHSSKSF